MGLRTQMVHIQTHTLVSPEGLIWGAARERESNPAYPESNFESFEIPFFLPFFFPFHRLVYNPTIQQDRLHSFHSTISSLAREEGLISLFSEAPDGLVGKFGYLFHQVHSNSFFFSIEFEDRETNIF